MKRNFKLTIPSEINQLFRSRFKKEFNHLNYKIKMLKSFIHKNLKNF